MDGDSKRNLKGLGVSGGDENDIYGDRWGLQFLSPANLLKINISKDKHASKESMTLTAVVVSE